MATGNPSATDDNIKVDPNMLPSLSDIGTALSQMQKVLRHVQHSFYYE